MTSTFETEQALVLFRASVRQWSEHEFYAPRPIVVKSAGRSKAAVYSLLIHAGVVTLMVFAGSLSPVRTSVSYKVTAIVPNPGPYLAEQHHGGGGGGDRSAAPVSKGSLPLLVKRLFVPPMLRNIPDPKLVLDAGLILPPDVPNTQSEQFGDPLANAGIASNGNGDGSGMGGGDGGGVGPSQGPGYRAGQGGSWGGSVYQPGGGVSAPRVLIKVDPDYSEDARKAKYQGTVLLSVVVDEHGIVRDIRVLRPLGLGLDQKAIEAVAQWKFRPGMKDGKPVAVQATIEVNFRLL
jgi:periplasmic protein TonB